MIHPLLTGTVAVSQVMAELAVRRPVFHSEADFQFAFAQAVVRADSDIEVRLEVRQSSEKAEYVDLMCRGPMQRTLVELKYPTAHWTGADPAGEQFAVRYHAAYDLARRSFVHDVARLEKFVLDAPNTDGVAIMLTNEPSLWTAGTRVTRDAHFRLHEGRFLAGHLAWGTGGPYDEVLAGEYTTSWTAYSDVGGPKGAFKYLALPVAQAATAPGGLISPPR